MLTPKLLSYSASSVDSEGIRQGRQEQELLWGGFVSGSGLGNPGL